MRVKKFNYYVYVLLAYSGQRPPLWVPVIFYEFVLYFKLSVFCIKYLHFGFKLFNLGHFFYWFASAAVVFKLVDSAFFILAYPRIDLLIRHVAGFCR